MLRSLTFAFFFIISFFSFCQINSGEPAVPFGSNSSYEFGMMPSNLPVTGAYDQSSEAADAYNEFKSGFVENCGANAARVKFDNQSQTVSEGVAYTMLLAAYAADQDVFNRVWQFYQNHMNNNGVMHWKISGCNTVVGFNGATDAEVDAAMALIIADKQWGSTGQVHNYKSDAITLIKAIKDHEINSGDKTFENGDAWKPDCRNPSYQAPAYARVWEVFMNENGEDGAFWGDVAVATENLHKTNSGTYTSGLSSNWCQSNGIANSSCSGSGTNWAAFGYDACRAPWRQGVDYLWHGNEADGMQAIVTTQINFWKGNGGATQVSGGDNRSQNGSGSGDHVGAFIGMIGAQSLASNNSSANQSFVNDMYSENVDINPNGYFNKVLRCLGLFVQTGNFWNPYTVTGVGGPNSTVSVSFTEPNEVYFAPGQTIFFDAEASTTSGSISKVEFSEGSTVLKTITSGTSYNYSSNSLSIGSHTITIKAYDDNGETKTDSKTVIVVPSIVGTSTVPVIDGNVDDVWDSVSGFDLSNLIAGNVSSTTDLSAEFKTMWDESYLYLLIDVTDDSKRNNSTQLYDDDGSEIYLDINNNKPSTPGADDRQFIIRWNDTGLYEDWANNTSGLSFIQIDKTDGYRQEFRIKWSDLGLNNPATGDFLGLDIQVNDDDNDGDATRDAKIAWAGVTDNTWQDPSLMRTMVLGSVTASGCSPPSLSSITNTEDEFCEGNSITLIANALEGYNYQWFRDGNALSSGGINNNSFVAELPGNYKVRIAEGDLNSEACYLESNDFNLVMNSVPEADINLTLSELTYCESTDDGASVSAKNAGAGASYSWKQDGNSIAMGQSVSLGEGTYLLETSLNGCSSISSEFDISMVCSCVKPTLSQIENTVDAFCDGDSLRLIANEILGNRYQWYKDEMPISSGGIDENTFVTSDAGNYKVRIADGDLNNVACYLESDVILITKNDKPISEILPSNKTYCASNESGVTVTAEDAGLGAVYEWENSSNGDILSGIAVNLTAGEYSLEVTKDECVSTSGSINITENENPIAELVEGNGLSYCEDNLAGVSVMATDVGSGSVYEWENSSSGEIVSGIEVELRLGEYILKVTKDGCVGNSIPFSVQENATPIAEIVANNGLTYCQNDLDGVTVTATNAGLEAVYIWKNSSTGVSLSGSEVELASGEYTLEVIKDGCSNTSEPVLVAQDCPCEKPESAVIISDEDEFCDGESVTISSNDVSGAIYEWYLNGVPQGVPSKDLVVSQAGEYVVRVANFDDASCYTESAPFLVTMINLPLAELDQDNSSFSYCKVLSTEGASVVANDAGPGAVYTWSKSETPISEGISTNLLLGDYTLKVEKEGCVNYSNPFEVSESCEERLGEVTIDFISPTVLEFQSGDIVNFSVTAETTVGSIEKVIYEENGALLNTITSQPYLFEFSGFSVGQHTIVATASNIYGVTQTTEITINIIEDLCNKPSSFIIDNGTDQDLCEGESAFSEVPFNPEQLYRWYRNDEQISSENSLLISEAGTYHLRVADKDLDSPECYTESEKFIVSVTPIPEAEILTSGLDLEYCQGTSGVTLLAKEVSGATFTWEDISAQNAMSSERGVASIESVPAGSYVVTVEKNECQNTSDKVEVLEKQLPLAELNLGESKPDICDGEKGVVSLKDAGFGSIYTWSNDLGFGKTKTNLDEGGYQVIVENGTCRNILDISVVRRPTPEVSEIFGGNEVCLNGGTTTVSLQVIQNDNSTYSWNSEVGTIVSSFDENAVEIEVTSREEGYVSVTEISEYGCESAERKMQLIYSCPNGIFTHEKEIDVELFPNPFSDVVYAKKEFTFELVDLNGIVVKAGKVSASGVDLSDVYPGVYSMILSGFEGRKVVKLVKSDL